MKWQPLNQTFYVLKTIKHINKWYIITKCFEIYGEFQVKLLNGNQSLAHVQKRITYQLLIRGSFS